MANKDDNKEENKEILLKYENKNFLIWTGIKEKNLKINEEPLTLNFDNQEYYFYSNKINVKQNIFNKKWIIINSLNFNQQKKVIDSFAKIIEQEDLKQKTILLELKYNLLKQENSNFNQNIKKIEKLTNQIESFFYNPNKEFIIEKLKINQQFKFIFTKFVTLKKNIDIYEKKREYNEKILLNQEKQNLINNITTDIEKIDDLLNLLNQLINKVLHKIKIQENKKLLKKEILFNPKLLWIKNKKIMIKYDDKKGGYLIWYGANIKDEKNEQEPLILNFGNEEYYFYSSGIIKNTSRWNKTWINFKTKLDYNNQEKILNALSSVFNEKKNKSKNFFIKIKI